MRLVCVARRSATKNKVKGDVDQVKGACDDDDDDDEVEVLRVSRSLIVCRRRAAVLSAVSVPVPDSRSVLARPLDDMRMMGRHDEPCGRDGGRDDDWSATTRETTTRAGRRAHWRATRRRRAGCVPSQILSTFPRLVLCCGPSVDPSTFPRSIYRVCLDRPSPLPPRRARI